jgi:hypothetical protein
VGTYLKKEISLHIFNFALSSSLKSPHASVREKTNMIRPLKKGTGRGNKKRT